MANSTTTKNNLTLDKVKSFVKSQLNTTPLIVNKQDKVRVGNYICQQSEGMWTVYFEGVEMERFVLRSSAVAWCIAMMTNQPAKAGSIVRQDMHYSRVAEDAYIYKTRFRTTKDEFKKELMWIRYEDTKHQLLIVRNRLKQYLKNINFS
jgi:hypothetical protein